mgnify:CR=1 FL=1
MTRESQTAADHVAPRFASAWAALAYAVCSLSLAWPALTGQFLVNANSDQYLAGYAFREFAASPESPGNKAAVAGMAGVLTQRAKSPRAKGTKERVEFLTWPFGPLSFGHFETGLRAPRDRGILAAPS